MRGHIVLVPFPFDDLSAAKLRPAVCLTEPVGPHHRDAPAGRLYRSSVMRRVRAKPSVVIRTR